MVTAEIAISLREEFGLTAASLAHPDAEFRYLNGIERPDRGVGLVEVRAEDVAEVLSDVEACEAVRALELLDGDERRALFQYETDVADLYRLVWDAGIVPAFPYRIREGTLFFTVTTTSDRLSRLGDALRRHDVPYEVTSVSRTPDVDGLLTDRQRRALVAAVEAGYYETPRACTLSELATRLGVASSTASELLHRAEGAIITHVAAELGSPPASNRGE